MPYYVTNIESGEQIGDEVLQTLADVNALLEQNIGPVQINAYSLIPTEPNALDIGDWIMYQATAMSPCLAEKIKDIWEDENNQLIIKFVDDTCYTIGRTLRTMEFIQKLDI